MSNLPVPVFSQEIRKLVRPKTLEFLDAVPAATQHAQNTVALFDHCFDLSGKQTPQKLLNQYLDAIFASLLLKNSMLNRSMVEAVNRYDFLAYAFAGRSLIEVTATLRYYIEKKIMPMIEDAREKKRVTSDQLRQLTQDLHRLLMGTRFDWSKFFLEGFNSLAVEYGDWLAQRAKNRGAKKWKANPLDCEQTNVATCLEAWAREEPRVGVLYDLFCDMVHPNIGSTLCIATFVDGGVKFQPDTAKCFGLTLFEMSYGPLQSLAGKTFAHYLTVVPLLKYAEDEL